MSAKNRDINDLYNNFLKDKDSGKFVDIHCHCLPGLDDGPKTMDEAIMLCRMFVDEGITVSVATSHQLGRYEYCNEAEAVREAVYNLNKMLKQRNIAVTIVPGGEVRVDERICQFLKEDKILTIADGGKYILLELPHEIFIDIEPLLKELFAMDIRAIISHVERQPFLIKKQDILQRWLEYSACLQITASSIMGCFGIDARKAAWDYLKSGLAGVIATDSHDSNTRKPYMKAAYQIIQKELGENIAHSVCIENPLRILHGRDIIPASIFSHEEILR